MNETINTIQNDLKNKFHHNFIFKLYDTRKNYDMYNLSCSICLFYTMIFVPIDKFQFDNSYNFKYIIFTDKAQYVYDKDILTCEEIIIKNIVE